LQPCTCTSPRTGVCLNNTHVQVCI